MKELINAHSDLVNKIINIENSFTRFKNSEKSNLSCQRLAQELEDILYYEDEE